MEVLHVLEVRYREGDDVLTVIKNGPTVEHFRKNGRRVAHLLHKSFAAQLVTLADDPFISVHVEFFAFGIMATSLRFPCTSVLSEILSRTWSAQACALVQTKLAAPMMPAKQASLYEAAASCRTPSRSEIRFSVFINQSTQLKRRSGPSLEGVSSGTHARGLLT